MAGKRGPRGPNASASVDKGKLLRPALTPDDWDLNRAAQRLAERFGWTIGTCPICGGPSVVTAELGGRHMTCPPAMETAA